DRPGAGIPAVPDRRGRVRPRGLHRGRGRRGADRGRGVHHAAGPARTGPARAGRTGAADHPAAVRPDRRASADAGGSRPGVRRDQGEDPADRVEDPGQAPPPQPRPDAPRVPRLNRPRPAARARDCPARDRRRTPAGRTGSGLSLSPSALDPGFHGVPAGPAHRLRTRSDRNPGLAGLGCHETRVPRGSCGAADQAAPFRLTGSRGQSAGRVPFTVAGSLSAACRPGSRSIWPRILLAPLFADSVSLGTRSAALSLATLVSSVALAPAALVAFCTVGFSATLRLAFTICS